MSGDQQVERLSQLLTRVQQNRRTRPLSSAFSASAIVGGPGLQPSAAANVEPMRTRRSTPPLVAAAPEAVTAAMPAEPPMPSPPRRPAVPARPSPLEIAFAGELDREGAAAAQAAPRRGERGERTERVEREPIREPAPAPRSQRPPAPSPIEASAPEEIIPVMIDPEPLRPSTRPIAQLVSKHAPPVDATFGAMLRRSLSLRPH